MNCMMTFPKTIDEFIDSYKFVDHKEVYTNGSELIPVFRVQQGLDYYLPKWISVTDRLPKKDGSYLTARLNMFDKTYEIESLFFGNITVGNKALYGDDQEKCWYYFDSEYGEVECDDVTHWMPFPEPPEIEQEASEVSNA